MKTVWGYNGPKFRRIVAARSRADAAKRMGISARELRDYGQESGNSTEIELANSDVGAVFMQPVTERADGAWYRADDGSRASALASPAEGSEDDGNDRDAGR